MTQTIIKDNLIKYINFLELDQHADKEKLSALKQRLQAGHCFGLSTIHAVMHITNKCDWWENALLTIAHWDGDVRQLEKSIELPDAESSAAWKKTKLNSGESSKAEATDNDETLNVIFERVLNYIIFLHGTSSDLFGIDKADMSQQKILSPSALVGLEFINAQGVIEKVSHKVTLSFAFDLKMLCTVLIEENFTDTIALVHSDNHTIHIYFKDGIWHIYDPEYKHTSLSKMVRVFDSKEEASEEILDILGHALSFEIAATNKSKIITFPTIHELIGDLSVLNKETISNMAIDHPAALTELFSYLTDHDKNREIMLQILSETIEKYKALHYILAMASESFMSVCRYLIKDEKGRDLITSFIEGKGYSGGWSLLNEMAYSCSELLIEFFEFADANNIDIRKALDIKIQSSVNAFFIGKSAREIICCYPEIRKALEAKYTWYSSPIVAPSNQHAFYTTQASSCQSNPSKEEQALVESNAPTTPEQFQSQ